MRTLTLRSFLCAVPLAVTALATSPALADDAANTATARALGVEGVTLADAGKCREAAEKLERAEKLHHAPTTATRLAECEIELGRLVSGTERLQRVVREPLPPNAHPAFVAAAARAQKDLDLALPRIATLRLSVKAPALAKLTITIDDEPASDAILDSNRRTDPGTHKIVVTAYGCKPAAVTAQLEEGQTKSVALELLVDPTAPPEPRVATNEAVMSEARGGSKAPAIVAFGVSALGLGAGIAGAVIVSSKSRALDGACDANRVCPDASRADISAAKQWATVSTVGFVTACAGLVSGVALLLAAGAPATPAPPPPVRGLRVRPAVGMTSLGVDGVF